MASGTRDKSMKEDTEITVTPPSPVNGMKGKEQEPAVRFDESTTARQAPSTTDVRDDLHDTEIEVSASGSKPKKSLFEITSVISTGNDFSRGESLGNDVEDSELDDTLSETQENVGSLPSSLMNVKSGDNSQNHFSSRFRIVKILRTEPYRKGRWNCQESVDPEVKGERQTSREDSKSNLGSIQPSASKHEHVAKPATETNKDVVGLETSGITSSKHDTTNSKQLTFQDSFTLLQDNLDRTSSNYLPHGDPLTNLAPSLTAGSTVPPDIVRVGDHPRIGDYSSPADSVQSATGADVPAVPIVNTIETALDQITVIKSTLLTVVKTEVERLKEIIINLTAENNQLKEENEKLKLLLSDEVKISQTDSSRKR